MVAPLVTLLEEFPRPSGVFFYVKGDVFISSGGLTFVFDIY